MTLLSMTLYRILPYMSACVYCNLGYDITVYDFIGINLTWLLVSIVTCAMTLLSMTLNRIWPYMTVCVYCNLGYDITLYDFE